MARSSPVRRICQGAPWRFWGADPLLADPIIRDAARHMARDEIHEAMLVLRNIVDLTGAYRLLAVMCCED